MKTWMLVASTAWCLMLAVHGAVAGDCGCCDNGCCNNRCCDCGCACDDNCDKVCKLVCEKKKITKIHYACECEDFCVPGRSCFVCDNCAEAPCPELPKDQCSCCAHSPLTDIHWKDWNPGECGCVKTRKKLVKYEVTAEVPSFKWVVEKRCAACACNEAKGAE